MCYLTNIVMIVFYKNIDYKTKETYIYYVFKKPIQFSTM